MALFIGIHDMGSPATDDEIQNSWSKYKTACAGHNCRPLHVHYNAALGRAFCITDAQSAEDVKAAHEEARVPLKEVLEVQDLQ